MWKELLNFCQVKTKAQERVHMFPSSMCVISSFHLKTGKVSFMSLLLKINFRTIHIMTFMQILKLYYFCRVKGCVGCGRSIH